MLAIPFFMLPSGSFCGRSILSTLPLFHSTQKGLDLISSNLDECIENPSASADFLERI